MVIVSKRFLKFFTGNFAQAITLWPFVIIKSSELRTDRSLLNHERIHLRQQLELFLIGFYLWYAIEFLIRWIKKKDANDAYHAICFEKEAYLNDLNFDYLKDRKFFAFIKYL
ncbi:hypothetical protein C3K47_00915 [Solitalea longa]|uniref:DUF4157 domain-containing protein n=1 Tax=Solitalea longa TaxID=2079460 RepID=A0A2S5A919_9SPHI|nr:hypothetical protein [Solitalea longa]POY39090.1 hypothetical protein C3K47_00915 [Solitalea longa]